ncbi:MAG: AAA family ATPase [Phycisphaeraceae bacterium]
MIKKIRITGFKSLYDVTVELEPVTVLVGRSGTGKSAFVQAVRFLRNYLLEPSQAGNVDGGWARLLSAGLDPVQLSLEITFAAGDEESDYVYLLSFVPIERAQLHGQFPVMEERLALGQDVLFHRRAGTRGRGWEWVTTPAVISPPKADIHLAISHLPSLEKVVYAYSALSSGIGYYNLPMTVCDRQPQYSDAVGQAHNTLNQHLSGLKDDGSNYLLVMRDIMRDFQHPNVRRGIQASLRQLNASVLSVELNSITSPQDAIVGHRVGPKTLDLKLSQESDGFRRFYAHLLALYQVPPKLVNIFEEPENGVYLGALALLADEFKAAPATERGQVILTTHSPGLLDHFHVDCLRVVDIKDGRTIIGPVAEEQREGIRENLLTTGELLTVDPARVSTSEPSSEKARA